MSKDTAKVSDEKMQELFQRFTSEIRNKTFVQAYIVVSDCIDQKAFAKRVHMDEGQFSRLLNKMLEKPVKKVTAKSKKTSK